MFHIAKGISYNLFVSIGRRELITPPYNASLMVTEQFTSGLQPLVEGRIVQKLITRPWQINKVFFIFTPSASHSSTGSGA